MLEEKVRVSEHVRIGYILWRAVQANPGLDISLFDIVNHLNYGIDMMMSSE